MSDLHPLDLTHLEDIGANGPDGRSWGYLETFRMNLLYMHTDGRVEGPTDTITDILNFPDAHTQIINMIQTDSVTTPFMLKALERVRELHRLPHRQAIFLNVLGFLNQVVRESIASWNKTNKARKVSAKQFNKQYEHMNQRLKEAVRYEAERMGEIHTDWTMEVPKANTGTSGTSLLKQFETAVSPDRILMTRQTITNMMRPDGILAILVEWLTGMHSLYRQIHGTTRMPDVNTNYLLFVIVLRGKPHPSRKIALNDKSVQTTWDASLSLRVNPPLDIVIRPQLTGGSKHTYVVQQGWNRIDQSWSKRNEWFMIFTAHNVFNLAHSWIWGYPHIPLGEGLSYKEFLDDRNNGPERLLSVMTKAFSIELPQPQFEQMIYELTGTRPNVSNDAPGDTEALDEVAARRGTGFVDPLASDPIEKERQTTTSGEMAKQLRVIATPKDGDWEQTIVSDIANPATTGLAEAYNRKAPPPQTQGTFVPSEPEPEGVRSQKQQAKDERDTTGMVILGLIGLLAFIGINR